MRLCRRLVRTWVFVTVAFLFCTVWYIDLVETSNWPSPPGSFFGDDDMTARYTISNLMNGFVAIFSVGIIFLAFDIRSRDVQSRISDVIDSQPTSNVELFFGRLAGIYLLLVIPCLVFLALITGYETISGVVESPLRLGVQPLAVLSFITWNLIPNLLFYSTLVALLSTLVRIRFLAAVLALGVLIGFFWINNYIPVRFQESFAQFLGSTIVPSDLAPTFFSSAIVGNRIGVLLVSISFLLFAASVLNRTEPRRRLNAILGGATLSVAVTVFFSLFVAIHFTEIRMEEWVKTHRQQSPESFPDIQHLEGTVELKPGNTISLDVTLTFRKPQVNNTDLVVFSLNPKYEIQQLVVNSEETSNFSFKNGLLTLPSNLLTDASNEMQLKAKGKPDDRFAYLDQARDFQKLTQRSVRQLGLRNSIFHRDYVALMPGIVWYPISGSVLDRDQLESRPRDVFTTDLKVTVPRNWHVATIGKRIEEENQNRNTFRFESGAPVPDIALIASNFDQRRILIEGIEFEVLFNSEHLHNLDALTFVKDHIQEWVAERINSARAASLDFPYKAFYVVEVPSNLRIYGGGWRMDTVLQPPGMMLIRESSFPTEQFDRLIVQVRDWGLQSGEEREATYVFDELLRYFGNDLQGGGPFAGISRNFVSHQLSVTERGATVLQYLLDQLSNQLITQTESASIISMSEYATYLPYLGLNQISDYRTKNQATQIRERIAALPSTWDLMNSVALLDLDFNSNAIHSYRVLLTKGHALAEAMIAHFGSEKIGTFLNQLLSRFQEQTLTLEDFLEVATSVGLNFDEWVVPWIEDTELPGFRVQSATISKLPSSEFNDVEYQTTFILQNAEPMAGIVRVSWSDLDERINLWRYDEFTNSDPIFIPGHVSKRITIRSSKPVSWIWVEPFLAHNRAQFEVLVPEFNENTIQESSALPFVSEVDPQPSEGTTIVVDDLDPNFSIVTQSGDLVDYFGIKRDFSSSLSSVEYEQGLLVETYPQFGEWRRLYDTSSFGLYRRTYARIARGNQTSAARFVASLPQAGNWLLEFYVPKPVFRRGHYGGSADFFGSRLDDDTLRSRPADPNSPDEHYTLQIRDGMSDRTENFDVANAKIGWNEVGKFELRATDVEVFLSDWAGHKDIMVHADAIRWIPVDLD